MSENKEKKSVFMSKLLKENPVFGLYLGICSTLAISTSINNAIGMGVCVTIVLVLSNILVSCVRNITPEDILAIQGPTAVQDYIVNEAQAVYRMQGVEINAANFAASFRRSVVDLLVDKTLAAARDTGAKRVAVAGGVAANSLLRSELLRRGERVGMQVFIPPKNLCTDNAVMIGSAAFYRLMAGEVAGLELNAVPALRMIQ